MSLLVSDTALRVGALHPTPPPPFFFSCIHYDNPEFPLPPGWLLYLSFFSSHCRPHHSALSVEENSFRSSLFCSSASLTQKRSSSINEVRSGLLINVLHQNWMHPFVYVCCVRRGERNNDLTCMTPALPLPGMVVTKSCFRCLSCSSMNILFRLLQGNHNRCGVGGLSVGPHVRGHLQ